MAENFMTEEDLQRQARAWANIVRAQAKANAAGFAKGKRDKTHLYKTGRYAGLTEGRLKDRLSYTLKKKSGELDAVSFKMPVHGIFREYGVGNGQPRGSVAVKSGRAASRHIYIRRSMSDWFHAPLDRNIESFADVVADYYGDQVLLHFTKL